MKEETPMSKASQPAESLAFRPDANIRRNAVTDWWDEMTPTIMVKGFKEAADMIVDGSQAAIGHLDRFLYPIATLYRHYLELQLKNISVIGRRYLGSGFTEADLQHHKLDVLWTFARRVIESHWPAGDRAEIDAAAAVVLDFHRWDPTGQSFRYYMDKKGRAYLDGKPNTISLDHLADAVHAAFEFLSTCELGLDCELEEES